ncbi:hypothetical protein [Bdellovibrio sp. HCB337]|uniref:hypothetical protein n=1 Tax=Bdellovibrio sp. HCB337 TaxID=3394358 RepID=UPI0039A598BD
MDLQHPESTREKERERVQRPLPELPAPFKFSTANQACWYLGACLLALGLVGFVVPGLFYAHLNPTHNVIMILTGIASILLGLTRPDYVAKKVCYALGGFYTFLGIAGYAFGVRAISTTRPTVSGIPEESSFLWRLIPGRLELGTVDHGIHLVVGLIFLACAYFTLRGSSSKSVTWH